MNSVNQNNSNQNGSNHIGEEDLMLFALQSLSEDQSAIVLEHLRHCEICRGQLGAIQGDLAAYALTSELQEPPAQARERFMSRVAREKKFITPNSVGNESGANESGVQESGAAARSLAERTAAEPNRFQPSAEPVVFSRPSPAVEPVRGQHRGRTAIAMAWAGWALAAAIGVFAFLQFQQRQNLQHSMVTQTASLDQSMQQTTEARESADRAREALDRAARAQEVLQTLTTAGAMQVSLHLPTVKVPQPEAHAAYIERTGALVLVASHLTPLAPGKTYQLWLLPANPKGAPVSAGLFKPNATGYASVVLPKLPKGIAAKGFGVTIEPEGGSSAPTLPIVLAGMGS